MGLLGKIREFFFKNEEYENVYYPDWDEETIKRDEVDMHDIKQRESYVTACLEQMAEASKELETLGGEYDLVTSYLTDIEEVEALPDDVKEQLKGYAARIVELENTKDSMDKNRRVMKSEDYLKAERIASFMPDGYKKIKEAEEYQVLVKRDLGRLEGERHAYHFRKNEVETTQKNMKGVVTICVGAMIGLALILAIISVVLHLDVMIGYAIAIVITAVTLTLVYVKYHESQRELERIERSINKLILLHNTVKIRYVNNTNLLDYLYAKYDVNSSRELKKLWDSYNEENKQREEENQMLQEMDFNQAALIKLLRKSKVQDPNIWLHQVYALIDSKEMVEIRHGLILRRQKLRKQMEYNAKVAQEAQDEVKDVVEKYPEYAKRILDMVSEYEEALA